MKNHYEIGSVVFGKWSIARRIGAGSFGTVYEIRREEFGQTYTAALKVITVPQNETELQDALDEGMTQSQAEDYFYSMVKDIVREFAIMARLKGTGNVVSYEDHEVVPHEGGGGWDILIRMELLNPLMPYAYDHPLTCRDVIRLGIDMCRALELCQRYNIIHRDIKPENIFVSDNGDFKLGDFGIARTIERTMSGLSKKGTYNYMAPEVYRGGEYGFSVDIYSLGIVLYRLLNNNRAPFLPQPPEPITYTQRETALAKRMGGEELPPPVNGRGRLGEIVLKACAFDPKARYSSPVQMRQELEAIQYGPEDGKVIYPSGDELSLYENQYASRRSQAGTSAPEPSAAPAPEAAEVTGKTESLFGSGAVNSLEPEKAPEEFFTPAGGEPEEFWPEEATERTEFVFRSDRPEPEPEPTYVPEPEFEPEQEWNEWEQAPAEKPKIQPRTIAIAGAALAVLLAGAGIVWGLRGRSAPTGQETPSPSASSSTSHAAWERIPESMKEYDEAGTLERIYNDRGDVVTGYRVRTDTDEGYQLAQYDGAGTVQKIEYYDADGKYLGNALFTYDDQRRHLKTEKYDASRYLVWKEEYKYSETGYRRYEFDETGYNVRYEDYDTSGTMTSYAELEYNEGVQTKGTKFSVDGVPMWADFFDGRGRCTRSDIYDENGKLEYYWLHQYDNVSRLARDEQYDSSGILLLAEEYDEAGNVVKEEYYNENKNGDMIGYFIYEYDAQGNQTRSYRYDPDSGADDPNAVYDYLYDQQGNLTRVNEYDRNNKLTSYGIPDDEDNIVWYNPDGTPQ